MTPEASLRYWLPGSLNGDRPLEDFVQRHVLAGGRVWDLGANVGVFAFLAAARCGPSGEVLAVEADPFLASLLLRSASRKTEAECLTRILTVAVSDTVALAQFAIPNRSRSTNFILETGGCTETGGVRFTFDVPCITLDWLIEQSFAPDVVKIDIEGMEARALRGATQLLRKVRPIFCLEVWDEIADEVTSIFHANDYDLFDGADDPECLRPVARARWATIAIPSRTARAL